MPAFSQACDMDSIRRSLDFRPDVKEAFQRALRADLGSGPQAALDWIHVHDKEAFDALTLIAVTTYYMQPAVRQLIGYPGQENVSYDPLATQEYLTDGSLGQVIAAGRKYKPTPDLRQASATTRNALRVSDQPVHSKPNWRYHEQRNL